MIAYHFPVLPSYNTPSHNSEPRTVNERTCHESSFVPSYSQWLALLFGAGTGSLEAQLTGVNSTRSAITLTRRFCRTRYRHNNAGAGVGLGFFHNMLNVFFRGLYRDTDRMSNFLIG